MTSKSLLYEKMKKTYAILILALLSSFTANAEPDQTSEFRHFVREFFKSASYQIDSVKFPLEYIYIEGEKEKSVLAKKFIPKNEWKHLSGLDYFKCKQNCYDIVIYDNFEQKHNNNNKRVLSFEGISNGINTSLYFQRFFDGWYLVKYENFSN